MRPLSPVEFVQRHQACAGELVVIALPANATIEQMVSARATAKQIEAVNKCRVVVTWSEDGMALFRAPDLNRHGLRLVERLE